MQGLIVFTNTLRSILFAGGVAFGVVAVADWAARTRRINPFNGVSRFLRANVDPRLSGVERQVVRAGGHPSATPWWALVAYVVIASLALFVVNTCIELIMQVSAANSPVGILALLVHWTFRFLTFAIIVRVIGSWFPRFAHSAWGRWSYPATEWMLRPLRRLIPTIGMIDITPIVAYFGLQIIEAIVMPVLFRGY